MKLGIRPERDDMNPELQSRFERLKDLANRYWQRLSEDAVCRRLGHHIAHVASELWLAQELAYLVNSSGDTMGLAGWSAVLEVGKVDVTLLPPPDSVERSPFYLELKQILPDWWGNWNEVYLDLGCHPTIPTRQKKPHATYAICVEIEDYSKRTGERRPATVDKYRNLLAQIPYKCGNFTPLAGFPPLRVVHGSPAIDACWQKPISGRYPEGYKSVVRIVWIERCGTGPGAERFEPLGGT